LLLQYPFKAGKSKAEYKESVLSDPLNFHLGELDKVTRDCIEKVSDLYVWFTLCLFDNR
jgi:hypothetical protein